MREMAFCFCLVIGFAAWVGSELASKSARDVIARECRGAGAFTVRRTGFDCWPIKK